ncbi:hypothetical protein [Flavobacterium sp. N1736]|uniref:hypothetical protein n=1 Tax=Flavobacterium sp. N1736 TaxID=2986823 RepID=UPI0022249A85|nr:hypothetical protein [Flavobacterium sp. N1736]
MRFKLKPIAKGLLFCWIMTLYSCENESPATNEIISKDKTISKAKEWLENNKPNLEALEYTQTVDWNNAVLLNNGGEEAVEVPIVLKNNISTNVIEDQDYKTCMSLLFIKNVAGVYNVFNIVYTTKNELLNNNDKSFNILNIGSEYSGYITIQKSDNNIAFSGKYENGEFSGFHNYSPKISTTSKLVCTYYVTVGNYSTCSNWVWYPDNTTSGGNLPPGYMPGISGPLYPNGLPPVDPCIAALRTNGIVTNQGFINARAAVVAASADGHEHSITLGGTASSSSPYTQSVMNNGGTNGVAVNESLQGAFAAIHNHPNNSALSSGDIYAAVTLNTKNAAFTTSFIITGGQTYAIVVNNLPNAKNFVNNYPPDLSPNYPPEFPNVIFDQIDFINSQIGNSIDSKTASISSVLDKYNAGITLMKLESNGKFNRIKIVKNADGSYSSVPCQ